MTEADDSGVSVSNLDHSSLSDTNPLIFQCSQCNSIVGDSLSWVSADKVMRTIALACVTSKVGVKSEITVVSTGRDQGSTYHELYCLQCNESLGKKYIASAPEIDALRGHFSLDAEKLNSYKLGSCDKCNDGLGDMVSYPTPRAMSEQIAKVKYLLVSMSGRVTVLEQKLDGRKEGEPVNKHKNHDGENEVARESDSQDTESVTSTENISSRFSYCSESEAYYSGAKDGDESVKQSSSKTYSEMNRTPLSPNQRTQPSPRIRTPLSPKSDQALSRDAVGNKDTGDNKFNRPFPEKIRGSTARNSRNVKARQCDQHSVGSQSRRQQCYSENECDGEPEPGSARIERWPHEEHVAVIKKRKRVLSPLRD